MGKFMVGDRVRVKYWNVKRPDFMLSGVVIACHNNGWYTVKHDDISWATYRRAKGKYDCTIGPRYDWQESDLKHLCGFLRFLASIPDDDGEARLCA